MLKNKKNYASPCVDSVEFITEQTVLVSSSATSVSGLNLSFKDLGEETQW